MVPSNSRVTWKGIRADFGSQPCHEIPSRRVHAGGMYLPYPTACLPKKWVHRLPSCVQAKFHPEILIGNVKSVPSRAALGRKTPVLSYSSSVSCPGPPCKKCASYREQLWGTFLISSHGESQEQPGLLQPLNETEMLHFPCASVSPLGLLDRANSSPQGCRED